MRHTPHFTVVLVFLLGFGFFDVMSRAGHPPAPPTTKPSSQPVKELHLDMDKAIDLTLPEAKDDLKPAAFKTKDGREGWVVRIPGNRPIATPAFAAVEGRGMLFVGGG